MSESYTCYCCGRKLNESNFYSSRSQLYSGTNRVPVCKDCLQGQFELYRDQFKNEKKAFQRMCMALDIYYCEEMFNELRKNNPNYKFADYVRKLNTSTSKGKTFDTSISEGFSFADNSKRIDSFSGEKDRPSRNMIKMWGNGYRSDDYEYLQAHYDYLSENNPNRTNNQEIFVKNLCVIELMKRKAQINNSVDDYQKLSKLYIDTFNNAGLTAKQIFDESDNVCFGTLIKDIQEYTPADFYKDKERYKDFDGIDDYFSRFILRPTENLINGTAIRDPEFSIEDDEN